MRKTTIIILAFFLIAVCVLLTKVTFQPRGRPNVSITFLGYTNDPTGTSVGIFAVSNLDSCRIHLYRPMIEIPAPAEPLGFKYYQGPIVTGNAFLNPGEGQVFTFPTPTNQSPWRPSFLVYNDFGPGRIIAVISESGRRMPVEIRGYWIENKQ